MKKFSALLFAFILSVSLISAQTIWVANNNPGASGGDKVFTSLQAAIDTASAGDIIHVIPSSVSYGAITISKSISVFGIGTNPSKEGATQSTTGEIDVNNGVTGVSGVVLSGLRVANRIDIANGNNFTVDGLLIENCYVIGDIILSSTTWSTASVGNLTIRSNVIGSGTAGVHRINSNAGTMANVSILNNIIAIDQNTSRTGINQGTNLGAVIANNLFYSNGNANSYAFLSLQSATVKNNIFYGVQPFGSGSVTGVTFNNNSSSNANSDIFPSAGNTLSGNYEGVDPLFVDVPILGITWNLSYDPTPTEPSLLNGGDDLPAPLDVGLTGGNIPYNFEGTNLPLIEQLSIPSAIIQGNTLPATIKAKGN